VKLGRLLAQALERGIEHPDGILYTDRLESLERAFKALEEGEN